MGGQGFFDHPSGIGGRGVGRILRPLGGPGFFHDKLCKGSYRVYGKGLGIFRGDRNFSPSDKAPGATIFSHLNRVDRFRSTTTLHSYIMMYVYVLHNTVKYI